LYIHEFKKKAERETFRRFNRVGHNDRSDAFRHCYWAALIARRYGFEESMRVTSYHEVFPGNPFVERRMDMHNNRVGAKIGKNAVSEADASIKCFESLKNGQLQYLVP
jgi:hypothetical protein